MHVIEESKSNKTQRISADVVLTFLIAFGLFFTIMQFVFFSKLLSIIGLIPTLLGFYLKYRVAVISAVGPEKIKIWKKNNEFEIVFNDIISVTKAVKFTITERYWLMLTFVNRQKKKDRIFFMNEPGFNLLSHLKERGVTLRNVP